MPQSLFPLHACVFFLVLSIFPVLFTTAKILLNLPGAYASDLI